MLLKLIVTIPTLAVSSMFSSSCEIQDPYIGPGGFGAKSIKVIGGDIVDVNCIVGQFEDEDFVYIIVDQECNGSPDYLHRLGDNRKFQIKPSGRGPRLQPILAHGSSLLGHLVDETLLIEGDLASPFVGTTPDRWLHDQGLNDLDPGDQFTRPIQFHRLSTSSWEADVTIGMTSDMVLPRFDDFNVSYAWFSLAVPGTNLECWSIRVQGDLSKIVRWLAASSVEEIDFTAQGHEWTLSWDKKSENVLVHRDGTLYEVFEL